MRPTGDGVRPPRESGEPGQERGIAAKLELLSVELLPRVRPRAGRERARTQSTPREHGPRLDRGAPNSGRAVGASPGAAQTRVAQVAEIVHRKPGWPTPRRRLYG